MKSIIFLYFVLINTSVFSENYKTYQLELVQALFRHGDRIPAKNEVYKTDPYDPEYYEPTGYGQLTNVGMQREYQIGQLLRKLYKNFLGEYKSNKVYAYSTDFDRTKISLQLVLAGLFPPLVETTWNKQLLWTPIPIHYQPIKSDFLQSSIKGICRGEKKMYQLIESIPQVQEYIAKHKDFLEYVQNKTEIRDTRIFTVCLITSNLQSIRSMNLTLPSWCTEQDFEILSDILAFAWKSVTMTSELRKLIAGPVVKQFMDNMKNHKSDDDRRIYLYSGHDSNIAPYTGVHNFTGIPPVPHFGSTVIIEKLRGSDNESYVRMFLWTGVGETLIKLKLENCDYECPLTLYEKLMEPVLPDPKIVECISRNLHCDGGSPNKVTSLRSETSMTMILFLLNVAKTIMSKTE